MKFDARCYRDGNNHTTLRTGLTSICYRHDGVCRMVSFYGRPIPNSADNDAEWVRKVSRASGDLVNVLMKEKERQPFSRVQETQHPQLDRWFGNNHIIFYTSSRVYPRNSDAGLPSGANRTNKVISRVVVKEKSAKIKGIVGLTRGVEPASRYSRQFRRGFSDAVLL
ncbi:hypothetical protein ALC57_07087 [Trachymyrmex cornetzi]|uniref:Uncharacterized protein n=1 Tax=Trachymyrmex cornetzi TaxID=471704 RepID=A0A195E6V1_9HYME|nr:hypothetical protein ALC57_07087 [Trachymyrmex cornetzi]